MPLIVEDGLLPENANSYVTLEQADAYLVPRGLWPATKTNENEPEQPDSPEEEEEIEETPGDDGVEAQSVENEEEEKTPPENPELPEEENSDPELPDTSKPDDNPDIAKKETALMRAFDYLDTLKWKGQRVDWQRQIAWPRKNVLIPGCNPDKPEYIAEDVIPDAVKRAQMELAALIYNGVDIFKPLEHGGKYSSVSDSFTKSVDVLSKSESHSVAYASNAPTETWLPSVYPLLRDFLDEIPGQTTGFKVHDVYRG